MHALSLESRDWRLGKIEFVQWLKRDAFATLRLAPKIGLEVTVLR